MKSFFAAIKAAISAMFSMVWVLIRTPLGWIWRQEQVPVTPAMAVSYSRPEVSGDDGLRDPADRHIDGIVRNYICMRLVNIGKPVHEHVPLPSLNGIPSAIASWARRLSDKEIRIAVAAKHTLLAKHLASSQRDVNLPIPFLPPVLSDALYSQMARAERIANEQSDDTKKKASSGGAGAGGGLKKVNADEQFTAAADMIEEVMDDFRARIGGNQMRPR